MVMAEEVKALLIGSAVVKERLCQSRGVGEARRAQAGRRLGVGAGVRRGLGGLAGGKAEGVAGAAARPQVAGRKGVVTPIELARQLPFRGGVMKQRRHPRDARVRTLERGRNTRLVGRGVAIAIIVETGDTQAVVTP